MTKRLSKALRGKRRWLGVTIDNRYKSRNDLEIVLEATGTTLNLSRKLRLMDFVGSDNYVGVSQFESESLGVAIMQVSLEDIALVREHLNQELIAKEIGISTITTSGKIRLVRERLSVKKKV